jgi:hypothetical protein
MYYFKIVKSSMLIKIPVWTKSIFILIIYLLDSILADSDLPKLPFYQTPFNQIPSYSGFAGFARFF